MVEELSPHTLLWQMLLTLAHAQRQIVINELEA